jgi:hypothetical protein
MLNLQKIICARKEFEIQHRLCATIKYTILASDVSSNEISSYPWNDIALIHTFICKKVPYPIQSWSDN